MSDTQPHSEPFLPCPKNEKDYEASPYTSCAHLLLLVLSPCLPYQPGTLDRGSRELGDELGKVNFIKQSHYSPTPAAQPPLSPESSLSSNMAGPRPRHIRRACLSGSCFYSIDLVFCPCSRTVTASRAEPCSPPCPGLLLPTAQPMNVKLELL